MHANPIQIAWHEAASVWSVDVATSNRVTRLVTAGGDKVVRIWHIRSRSSNRTDHASSTAVASDTNQQAFGKLDFDVVWISDLRDTSTVNVVRFSPNGRFLATGAEREIVLWRLTDADPNEPSPSPAFANAENKQAEERWERMRTLRGHGHDILDLCWSPDASLLASVSVDNTAKIWTVPVPASGKPHQPINLRHTNFVQGVAFSPDGSRLATLGNDRTLRIYSRHRTNASKWECITSVSSAQKLFVDDFKSKNLVRRVCWSPDSNLLLCPSGIDVLNTAKKQYSVHVFARTALQTPMMQCGGLPAPAVSVRFCPLLFALRNKSRTTSAKTDCSTKMQVDNLLSSSTQISNGPSATMTTSNSGQRRAMMEIDAAENKAVHGDIKPTGSSNGQCSQDERAVNTANVTDKHKDMQIERTTQQDEVNGDNSKSSVSCTNTAMPVPPLPTATGLECLKYRMVFAIVCTDAVYLYDTECFERPIARISGLHLAEQTDGNWSHDGRMFFVSSTDGYVSCIRFEDGELGRALPAVEYPKYMREQRARIEAEWQSKQSPSASVATAENQVNTVAAEPVRVVPSQKPAMPI